MYYIAYGSNLNLDDMRKRCPNSHVIGKTTLDGYQLEFRHYLNIIRSEDDLLPVGIFEISPMDIDSLDEYEGYPELYRKEYLDVDYEGETINCLVYIMNDDSYKDNLIPSKEYLMCCYKGYDDFGFDHKYIDKAYIKLDYKP